VRTISIFKNNNFFAAGIDNGEITIFDLSSFQVLKKIKAYDNYISSIQVSPSDKLLATCGNKDGKIIVFNIEDNFSEKY
jgi:WD40 repeat protein